MSEKLSEHDTNPVTTCHVSNHMPDMQDFLIRTKFKMINICRGKMGGLVSSCIKFQITSNCRDEMHI